MKPIRLLQATVKANQPDYKGFRIEAIPTDFEYKGNYWKATNDNHVIASRGKKDLYKKIELYLRSR